MCDTAARLVDNVLPDIRLRQWVLSIPFELRIVLAKRSDVLNACGRIFVQEIFRWQRQLALLRGYKQVIGAAINFPQRFGGSLNLNVHFHVLVPDGFSSARRDFCHDQRRARAIDSLLPSATLEPFAAEQNRGRTSRLPAEVSHW
jgi:hypothetical protein